MAKKLFVGNLSFQTSEDTLRNAFEQFGEVASAKIMMDRMSGRSRGFAFVEMNNDEEAEKAIAEMNEHELDGRKLIVNEARPMVPRERGSQGGSFGPRRSFNNRY